MDTETRTLDRDILKFMADYSVRPAPDERFGELALRIFRYQFERNTAYRRWCRTQGCQTSGLDRWQAIPAMPAFGFKELVLTTFPLKKAVRIFRTSGTTQERRGRHAFETLALYEAAWPGPFKKALLPDRSKMPLYFLTASARELPDSSLSFMMGCAAKRFSSGRARFYVRGGRVHAGELFRDLRRVRSAVMILGTAFSLKIFLDELDVMRLRLTLPAGSRLMETGGFKGRVQEVTKRSLYAQCRRVLGIAPDHCISEYGMTELTSQFYDTTLSDRIAGLRRRPRKEGPAWLRTLVIDPVSGREARAGSVGLLRHVDLANRGSVLAVQTEDLGRRVGSGFELVGRARSSELRGCSLFYEDLAPISGGSGS